MRHLADLAWKAALALGLVFLLGYFAATRAGSLTPHQVQAVVAGMGLTWLGSCAVVFALGWRFLAPVARLLDARDPVDPALAEKTAEQAGRLPILAAVWLAVLGMGGCAASVGSAFAGLRLPFDLALAVFGIGTAIVLLAVVIARAVCARGAARMVERLGASARPRGRNTMRGRIVLLGVGVNAVAVLLVASAGYIRNREAVIAGLTETSGRVLETAIARDGRLPAAELGRTLRRDLGAPVAILSPGGQVLASEGRVPALPADGLAPGAVRTRDGWVVVRERPGGFAAALVGEDDVLARLGGVARSALFAALVAFAGTAMLAWLAAAAITSPIGALGQAADRIASGDLTVSPPSTSADEMGQLAAQFRRMAQGLSLLVREVKAASLNVSVGAAEAGSIGEQVRRGALEQHADVRAVQTAVEAMEGSMAQVSRGLGGLSDYVAATSRSVSEMAEAFDEVRSRAAELERGMVGAAGDVDNLAVAGRDAEGRLTALENLAARSGGTLAEVKASVVGLERAASESESTAAAVAEMADRAGLVMEGTVHGIETLRGAVSDAHERIAALGRRSDDIDQVVDFISEVAGRTNLLSLNASIIASQAGEHGKAFAVVADQIRDLAAQIARSTKSIGDIIHAVREDVEGTAALIDRGDALAVEGVQLARNSLEALADIRRSTARGRDTAAGIRSAVQVHAQSSREVANLVEAVAEGSRAVAAAVQLVGRSVGGAHSVSRGVTGMADRVARTLEEQASMGKHQLENLSRLEAMIREITRAVESHAAATQHVKRALEALSHNAGQHESAVQGLSGVSDQIGSRARALAESVDRFKV